MDTGYDANMNNPNNVVAGFFKGAEYIQSGQVSGENIYAWLKQINGLAAKAEHDMTFGFGEN
jgi:hypothetical protein